MYINELGNTVNKCNNTYHKTNNIKPVDAEKAHIMTVVTSKVINNKDPKFKIGAIIKIFIKHFRKRLCSKLF